jgi:membrane glycosyltransferase
LYAAITLSLNFTIGYFALGVGWMVGAAMKKASSGLGGKRYQVAAALLTYLAISAAGVPVLIHAINKDVEKHNQELAARSLQNDADAVGTAEVKVRMDWSKVQGLLIKYAVASPFMELEDGVSGIIGLVIIAVGVSIAWRMTARRPLQLEGPYSITAG